MAKKRHLMGEINLLGLEDFGAVSWSNPLIGAAVGGGTAEAVSLAIGHTTMGQPYAADRNFWAMIAGLAASGIMWLSGPSRARGAAMGGVLGTLFVSGLPWLEQKLLGTAQAPTPIVAAGAAVAQQAAAAGTPLPTGTAGMRGLGIPKVKYLNGLGIPKVSYLNGLGLPSIAPQPPATGTIPGVAGPAFAGAQIGAARPPINLLGNPTAASRQVSLLGGPAVHGLSSAYGATLLGGGRG